MPNGRAAQSGCVQRRAGARVRRNSQTQYAAKEQTCIFLDWDDTLFPTSHFNRKREGSSEVKSPAFESRAAALLRMAHQLGRVVIVTLADKGWVERCCDEHCPLLGELLEELRIKIVNAKVDDANGNFATMKRYAISSELHEFYSQYDRQSWKNVISIGDSNFERLGTMQATADYMWERCLEAGTRCDQARPGEIDVEGHIHKVRTKTLKIIPFPTIDDLAFELSMVHRWLPAMARLDQSFDMQLSDLKDPAQIRAVQAALDGSGIPDNKATKPKNNA
jgi:hypothetical protein